jgi:uncharacterized linocin/CFP29 family protein
MASSYSTDLKLELMVTGENAGTWGDITNTNLVILQQAIAGYQSVAVNATTGLTLTFTNAAVSDGKNAVLQLTGTPTTNINVNVPDGIEKTYFVNNQIVHGTNTVTLKTVSGTGIQLAQGNRYTLYSDGTNVNLLNTEKVYRVVSSNITTQPGAALLVDTSGGARTITLPASPATGAEVSFIDADYTFDTNALTVGRNGSNIANAAADLVVNTEGAGFTLVYSGDATVGWTYRDK